MDFAPSNGFSRKKTDTECNDRSVEEVVEEAADHRDDEVGRGRGTVAARNGLHVGHGVGRGAHAEADEAGGDHRGIVIAAHGVEYDKVGEQGR